MLTRLEKYKKYLDAGTVESSGIDNEAISRYQSFKKCMEFLENKKNKSILELGTTRSFTDGKYEGCNSDNTFYWNKDNYSKWDWGAGCFTLIFGQLDEIDLTTVDVCSSHIERCKFMTSSLGIQCTHVVSDSVEFLKQTDKEYAIIYLDTGDMTPIEATAQKQLEEVKIIIERKLLMPLGYLLIDDVMNKTPKEHGDDSGMGKSKYSIPYLYDKGYLALHKGYQYILFHP